MTHYYTGSCDPQRIKETVWLNVYHTGVASANTISLRDKSVFLINEKLDLCRQLVDKWGNIRNYPGIQQDAQLIAEYGSGEPEPVIRFSASFYQCPDSRYMMVWTIRPDGRFWMDDWGFGEEDDEAVMLYSYLDEKGDFDGPFRLYSIGSRLFGEYCIPGFR